MTTLFEDDLRTPAGNLQRFGSRWRLVSAGLSDVWRYGDLVLDAPSGRLLLRGPNGTGKTTALEALWPFLLDLNRKMLSAGKARTTSLRSLMREGAQGRRRVGYLWMTLAEPGTNDEHTFGVRVDYSESTPPALLPFTVPGRPLDDLPLHGPGRASVTAAIFEQAVRDAGGQTFDEAGYVSHLAARVWNTSPDRLTELAQRLRVLRNPSLLAGLSPADAAAALREALPAVDPRVVTETGEALAESDATRAAFARDQEAAEALTEFAAAWSGHVVDVVTKSHAAALEATATHSRIQAQLTALTAERSQAALERDTAHADLGQAGRDITTTTATIEALKDSEAYSDATELANRKADVQRVVRDAASARTQAVSTAAQRVSSVAGLRADLEDFDVAVTAVNGRARAADPAAPVARGPLIRVTDPPAALIVDARVDPGATLAMDVDVDEMAQTARGWTDRGQQLRTRAAAADMAVTDHQSSVEPARDRHDRAVTAASAAAHTLEQARTRLREATAVARGSARTLLDDVRAWMTDPDNEGLLATTGHADTVPWEAAAVEDLHEDEPGLVISQVRQWQDRARDGAATREQELRTRAHQLDEEATTAEQQARQDRQEAARLRDGHVLPLPRPAWVADLTPSAGGVDEGQLFGSALMWAPDVPADVADRVESALAASGLLGAQLDTDGLTHPDWVLHSTGPRAPEPTLATVVHADPDHPHAAVVSEVLARIHLDDGATPPSHPTTIGTDATFTLGPVRGYAPGHRPQDHVPQASHIGATRRRQAALARAAQLEAGAGDLDQHAQTLRQQATSHRGAAKAVRARAHRFPSPDQAAKHESRRAVLAEQEAEAARTFGELEAAVAHARDTLRTATSEWVARTRGLDLPADVPTLTRVATDARRCAEQLTDAACDLEDLLTRRLPRLRARLADTDPAPVMDLIAAAHRAAGDAEAAQSAYTALEQTVGTAAAEVVRRIGEAREALEVLRAREESLTAQHTAAVAKLGELDGRLREMEPTLHAAAAGVQVRRGDLVTLLTVPGVSALLAGPAAADRWWDPDPVARVGQALEGKKGHGSRALTDRYDTTRARIGDAWTLNPGDPVGTLLTYELTHRDVVYDPVGAAAHGTALADQAQAALNAAEDEALRRFVVGLLPQAVGQAWQGIIDWVAQVNGRMREAAASSGLKVIVRAPKLDDLNPAEQTVVDLACKLSEADRTEEQSRVLGQALRDLIAAADGDTMTEKVAAAIDVRRWVNVMYLIDRGNGREERWGPRTGLSGGERRLVVLAPMLAAAAAGYDALGPTGLRLIALDEVPAEVDERGREGLARYTAALDLDLVATSYLWDGAPGAWDGVDAWDLEAGSDGTVVGFPMQVRGVDPLPGERR